MKNNIELKRPFLPTAQKTLVAIALVVTAAYAANAQDTNTFPGSGNAGIGTTSPTAPLEINKNQNAGTNVVLDNPYTSAGNAAYSGFWFRQNGANRFFVGSNNDGNTTQNGGAGGVQFWNFINAPILFATNNNERFRISGNGQVGIGTSAPNLRLGQKLDIAASGDYSGAVFSTWSSSSAASLLDLNRSKSNTIGTQSAVANNDLLGVVSGRGTDGANFLTAAQMQFWVDGSVSGNVVPGRIVLNVTDTSGTAADAMTIRSSGNVGIGTTSPTHKFVVGSGTASSVNGNFGIVNAGGDQAGLAAVSSGQRTVYLFSHSSGGTYGLNAWDYGSNVYLPVTINWGGSNTLLNTNGGNVGIGNTSPAYKLDVAGAINATALNVNGSPVSGTQWSTSGSNISYSTGNVGIGTSASGYKLDVNGNTNVTGNLNVTGNINAKYQDVAEWVPSSEQLTAGTVVVLDTTKSNQVIASAVAYDTRVAGVISAQPGITLGESGEGKVLVATTGRVRVKVDASRGPIQIGDLLVTSDVAGVAMKSEAIEFAGRKMHMPGTIIGKALEPLAKGKGEILVLLSLQ